MYLYRKISIPLYHNGIPIVASYNGIPIVIFYYYTAELKLIYGKYIVIYAGIKSLFGELGCVCEGVSPYKAHG